jgi:glucose-1-phosphate thymidylyltransferase
MDAVILAGGFARRMWPLTKDRPKHLLPLGGRPMLSYVLDRVFQVRGLDRVFLTTNSLFQPQFADFLEESGYPEMGVELYIEDARAEEEKLGSVGAMGRLFREMDITGPALVVGGDNLFEFDPAEMISRARELECHAAVACRDVGDASTARLYGILTLDEDGMVAEFAEKPERPSSTLAATACYYLSEEGVSDVHEYLSQGGNPDAMGHFMAWLHKRRKVLGWRFAGYWYDIGSLEGYREADRALGPGGDGNLPGTL